MFCDFGCPAAHTIYMVHRMQQHVENMQLAHGHRQVFACSGVIVQVAGGKRGGNFGAVLGRPQSPD